MSEQQGGGDIPPEFFDITQRVTLADDLGVGIGNDGRVTISLRQGATVLAKRLDLAEADELVERVQQAVAVIRARASGTRPAG
jgi:hypothetical protein